VAFAKVLLMYKIYSFTCIGALMSLREIFVIINFLQKGVGFQDLRFDT
jgi:hypothetical protein